MNQNVFDELCRQKQIERNDKKKREYLKKKQKERKSKYGKRT